MNAPVDIKSYFQDLLCFLSGRDDLAGFEVQQTEDVAAAVAKLIEFREEVARIADDYIPDSVRECQQSLEELRDALKGALARVGGAK